MTELEELQLKQAEIEKRIEKDWNHCGEKIEEPVYDGVLNCDLYLKQGFPKVLWILQEPYGDGDWHFRDLMEKFISNRSFGKTRKTWEMIMYVSWSIYNAKKDNNEYFRLTRWNDIPDYKESPLIMTALRNIAFMNVKKHPNTTGTNSVPARIKNSYEANKDILLGQIEICAPDIIIGGNTLRYFYPDFRITNEQICKPKDKCINYSSFQRSPTSKKTLLVDAYHPAYREFSSTGKRCKRSNNTRSLVIGKWGVFLKFTIYRFNSI